MKVRSTSALRRTLAALTLTAALGLTAACGGGQDDASQASDGGGQAAPAASDGGGAADDPQAQEADVSDVPEVVATVNGTEITKDDFVQTYQSQYQQMAMQQQAGGQAPDEERLKTQVAERLVNNESLRQGAEDADIKASDKDIDTTLDEIAKQSGLGSGDEVVSALEQAGHLRGAGPPGRRLAVRHHDLHRAGGRHRRAERRGAEGPVRRVGRAAVRRRRLRRGGPLLRGDEGPARPAGHHAASRTRPPPRSPGSRASQGTSRSTSDTSPGRPSPAPPALPAHLPRLRPAVRPPAPPRTPAPCAAPHPGPLRRPHPTGPAVRRCGSDTHNERQISTGISPRYRSRSASRFLKDPGGAARRDPSAPDQTVPARSDSAMCSA
ncbi:SurA N-terminal domain-containing protein [Brachybacterium sp. GPGPB12]|uniref:SurA N-terminal domain-containing protein n=1 Tax=Brachybacterium sp. GPGPB12 TaxID=3023517 RepID=UPI0031344249